MKEQVQFFEIANLIFSMNKNSHYTLQGDQIAEIQKRFQNIVDSFRTAEKDYATGFIKKGGDKLPYNSVSAIGVLGEQLVLHFTCSYNEPVIMLFDVKNHKLRNFIDIEQAKYILHPEVYEDVKERLQSPKFLNNRFKGIPDINRFVDIYQEILQQHNNAQAITGRDCFEIDLDDLEL